MRRALFTLGGVGPVTAVGWLYVAVLCCTTVAPALGAVGTVLRISLALVVAAVTAILLVRERSRFPRWLAVVLGLLLVTLAFAAIQAPSLLYGVGRFANWVLFIPLVVLVFIRPDIRAIASGLVMAGSLQMVGVGLQLLGLMGGVWGGLMTSGRTYTSAGATWLIRYTGYILDPNNLALLLALGSFVLIAACFSDPIRWRRVAFGGAGVVFVLGIVLTGSRGGLVALALGALLLLLRFGRRGVLVLAIIVGGGFVALQVVHLNSLTTVVDSFTKILQGKDVSAASRVGNWQSRLASGGPGAAITGNGFGGYARSQVAQQTSILINPAGAKAATVDNGWLKLLLECGVVGLLLMGIIVGVAAVSGYFWSKGSGRLAGIVAGGAMAAVIWRAFSVDMLDLNPWNAIIFMIAGVCFASWRSTSLASERIPRKWPHMLRSGAGSKPRHRSEPSLPGVQGVAEPRSREASHRSPRTTGRARRAPGEAAW